jgi:chromosome partitioning protein
MKTIALVCQKGGTGKTTMAISLAVAAERAGLVSAVIDLDPQVSACEWSDMRSADSPIVVDAQPARLEGALTKARENGIDIAFIDTAGRTEQAAMAASRFADLILIPLQASVVDLKTVRATRDLIAAAGGRPHVAVLTRVKPHGTRHEETIDWLKDQGLEVCPAMLGDRVVFQDSYSQGLAPQEYEPGGKAAQEAENVYMYTSSYVGLQTSRETAQ